MVNHCNNLTLENTNVNIQKKKVKSPNSSNIYICPVCLIKFPYHLKMRRHQITEQEGIIHQCEECKKSFSRQDTLKRHMKVHKAKRETALLLRKPHRQQKGAGLAKLYESINSPTKESCLNTFFTYTTTPKERTSQDLVIFLKAARNEIIRILQENSSTHHNIKWYINVCIRMTRHIMEDNTESCTPHFRSNCSITLFGESPDNKVDEAIEKVLSSFNEFDGRGSGWLFDSVSYLETKISLYKPLN